MSGGGGGAAVGFWVWLGGALCGGGVGGVGGVVGVVLGGFCGGVLVGLGGWWGWGVGVVGVVWGWGGVGGGSFGGVGGGGGLGGGGGAGALGLVVGLGPHPKQNTCNRARKVLDVLLSVPRLSFTDYRCTEDDGTPLPTVDLRTSVCVLFSYTFFLFLCLMKAWTPPSTATLFP